MAAMFERLGLLWQPQFRRQAFSSLDRRARQRLPLWARRALASGDACYCPVCESRVATFRPFGDLQHAWCPVCGVMPWHRLAWLVLKHRTSLLDAVPTRLLHVAPEPEFARRFSAMSQVDYLPVDMDPGRPMIAEQMDITRIRYPEGSFDAIYCSHVLEHVPDDALAMREMHRVLKASGWALLVVPLYGEPTIEDPDCADPAERERRFGQFDHVRCYGPDFADRLRAAGFQVRRYDATDVVDEVTAARIAAWGPVFLCAKGEGPVGPERTPR